AAARADSLRRRLVLVEGGHLLADPGGKFAVAHAVAGLINAQRGRVGRGQNFPPDQLHRHGRIAAARAEFRAPEQDVHRQPERHDAEKCQARGHGGQGAGRFSTWPALSFFGMTPGFAACNDARLILYLRAMRASVSRLTTLCVRGLTAFNGAALRGVVGAVLVLAVVLALAVVTSSGDGLVACVGVAKLF